MTLAIVGVIVSGKSSPRQSGSAPIVRVPIGQTILIPANQRLAGIAAITVYSLVVPYSSPGKDPGTFSVFGLGDAQVCAGSRGADLTSPKQWLPLPFSVVLANGDTPGMIYNDNAKEPELSDIVRKLKPNQCARGYLTFAVAAPSTVVAVGYGGPGAVADEWLLPAPASVGPLTTTTTQP